MENIIIGFAIGAVLMLIILIIQITKNRGRIKPPSGEISRLKAMLSDPWTSNQRG